MHSDGAQAGGSQGSARQRLQPPPSGLVHAEGKQKIAYRDAARKRDRRMNNVISIFKGDSGGVVNTFLAARGVDMLNAAYHQLDLPPKGRNKAAFWQA